jgi:26-hydroxylase
LDLNFFGASFLTLFSLTVVQSEVEMFLQSLARQRTAPVEIGYYLSSAVSNVICSLLMSVRFRHDDPRFIRFMNLIDEGFRLFTITAVAGFIPILRFLPGFNYAYSKIRQVIVELTWSCSHNFYMTVLSV